MRLLTAAFLLLLGSDANGRAGISVHRHHSAQPGIATANHSALLATTPERKHVDTARPQLLASEARLHDRRVRSAPAPARKSLSLCSYERTTGQAAREAGAQIPAGLRGTVRSLALFRLDDPRTGHVEATFPLEPRRGA